MNMKSYGNKDLLFWSSERAIRGQ